jgi:hypothetical protein
VTTESDGRSSEIGGAGLGPAEPRRAKSRERSEEGARGGTTGSPTLEERALEWIQPHWNLEHLVRARDWLLVLDPDATEEMRLAALLHDVERQFPGGPVQDLSIAPEDDMVYRRAHAGRSAEFVERWLREQGAEPEFVEEVARLVRLHEEGGDGAADLVQAADSLSFLEVNIHLPERWAAQGRCSVQRGIDQHRWMLERIRVPRARELAEPLFERVTSLAA